MKKLILTFCAVLAFTAQGFANATSLVSLNALSNKSENIEVTPSFTNENSHFNQLVKYFNQGTLPTQSDITGWWAGRLYTPTSLNKPTGGWVLATSIVSDNSGDEGPLFPVEGKFAMGVLGSDSFSSNRYDNLASSDAAEIQRYVNSSSFKELTVSVDAGSLSASSVSGNLKYSVRKFGNFLFVVNTVIHDSGNLKAGDIWGAGYFYKKIH